MYPIYDDYDIDAENQDNEAKAAEIFEEALEEYKIKNFVLEIAEEFDQYFLSYIYGFDKPVEELSKDMIDENVKNWTDYNNTEKFLVFYTIEEFKGFMDDFYDFTIIDEIDYYGSKYLSCTISYKN